MTTFFIHFFWCWFYLAAPASFFSIEVTHKQKILFAFFLSWITILVRSIYKFGDFPFGTHTFLFAIGAIILMKIIVRKLKWIHIILIIWMCILMTAVTEACIIFPIIKYFNMTLSENESNPLQLFLLGGIGSNIGLILMWWIGKYKKSKIK